MQAIWICQREAASCFFFSKKKVKFLNLIKKEKKLYTEIAKIYGKNESSINDIGKKKKTFMLVLLFHLKLQIL